MEYQAERAPHDPNDPRGGGGVGGGPGTEAQAKWKAHQETVRPSARPEPVAPVEPFADKAPRTYHE